LKGCVKYFILTSLVVKGGAPLGIVGDLPGSSLDYLGSSLDFLGSSLDIEGSSLNILGSSLDFFRELPTNCKQLTGNYIFYVVIYAI